MELEQFLKLNPKKKLIFDFDETLVHLLLPWDDFKKHLKQVISQYDPEILIAPSEKMVNYVNRAVQKHNQPLRKIILKLFTDFESQNLRGAPVNQRLVDFCQKNQNNYRFYIWTSNMLTTVLSILRKNNLDKIFAKIITRDKVVLTKPYPEGFYKIYNPKLDKKKDFLLIGDSQHDQQAAKNSGIDFFCQSFNVGIK